MASVLPHAAHASGTHPSLDERWPRVVARLLLPTSSGAPTGPGPAAHRERLPTHLAYLPTQGNSLTSGVPASTLAAMRKTVSGVRPEPVTLDDVKLPAHLEAWLDALVGRIKTSFIFDPDTYFDESDLYDR